MADAAAAYFLGGEARFPSVRIRCLQIAAALGCQSSVAHRGRALPDDAAALVLVKYRGALDALIGRAPIVWDVIDDVPPTHGVDCYLFSTAHARDRLRDRLPPRARTAVIPHHHCNVARLDTRASRGRDVYFVGGAHWTPALPELAFQAVDTTAITLAELREVYARAHVLLNLRVDTPAAHAHGQLASGIKLINAIGFGVPSVSSREPAFDEIGAACTRYATAATAAGEVRRLQTDRALYDATCAALSARAERYHLDTIAGAYRALLASL
jgi:hypothetical protein